jgi:hypothetical protein
VTTYPDFLHLADKASYQTYYETELCSRPWLKVRGSLFPVMFYADRFEHAFCESLDRAPGDKSQFSWERSKRMDWIKVAVSDPESILTYSYNKGLGKYDITRMNILIQPQRYVVIIRTANNWQTGKFHTAFPLNDSTLAHMLRAPHWVPPSSQPHKK